MSTGAIIWCPFPDRESARLVANTLLDEKLIACANIIGEVESLFEWDGAKDSCQEVGVLFKSLDSVRETLIQRLGDLHPYDTPAILGWQCDIAHPATLGWLQAQIDRVD